jgi:hypothetical protein
LASERNIQAAERITRAMHWRDLRSFSLSASSHRKGQQAVKKSLDNGVGSLCPGKFQFIKGEGQIINYAFGLR